MKAPVAEVRRSTRLLIAREGSSHVSAHRAQESNPREGEANKTKSYRLCHTSKLEHKQLVAKGKKSVHLRCHGLSLSQTLQTHHGGTWSDPVQSSEPKC